MRSLVRPRNKRQELLGKLEAPPGFEPGMEVLQIKQESAISLTRLVFWYLPDPRFTRCLGGYGPKWTQVSSSLFYIANH